MLRLGKFFILFVMSCLVANGYAQSVDSLIIQGKKLITAGVEAWDAAQMQKTRAHFERLLAGKKHEALMHYYLGYCDYRLAAYYLQKPNQEMMRKHLEEAINHLEAAVKLDNKHAEAYALLSSCYGQMIGLEPNLGMTLGPKSGQMMQTALQLAPNNPRVILLNAISTYFTPAMYGGDKEKGLAGFKRAAELFEKEQNKDPLQPDWGHAEAYAWMGVAYLEKNDNASARTALERALAIAPNYGWVKYQLYPKVAK
ncbi:MAG: TRAP transporter TatT component family protein [candidate division KSB1 bacterium]|nr:TRAP transporter TatT component family protein [candidate division KSB1 bacterium]MDZ7304524.1 TRAP transporter TatT component family protein [candidate division KSB1 bacterium]MDZ7314426.1 TRAP transporter TatT component family protein [candidate division KSB1 bacterium]